MHFIYVYACIRFTSLQPIRIVMEFNCSVCKFECAHKCDYDRHVNTQKHKTKQVQQPMIPSTPSNYSCNVCGKTYKYRSGLSIHKRTTHLIASNQDKQFSDLIGVVKDLMEHNKEVVSQNKDMIHQNKILVDAIQSKMANDNTLALTLAGSCGGIGNRITNNTNHIINNTQFNLQVFLNEDCKDAIKLSDFVKTLKITLQDLEFTKTNGIVEGVSSIIVNNLKGMDVHKRPIHCTDMKRETMYVKADEWIKDDDGTNIKKFIYLTSCYQIKRIQDWIDAHPGWESNEKLHTEYLSLCKELYKNIENDDHAHKKIIKGFIKNIQIDRHK